MLTEEKSIEEKIREAKRQYYREWARKNPEKVKAKQQRYWLKKAMELQAEADGMQRGGEE